ncbi:MAG: FtsW/RodA/SpoVE family cell cycle protein [Armatimonadota bacterium]
MAQTERLNVKPAYDARWVSLIFGAVMIGLVMAFSASYPNASRGEDLPGDAFRIFKLHGLFVIAGLIMMSFAASIKPAFWSKAALVGFVVSLALMLLAIILCLASGEKQRGAMQWVPIGPFKLQPSEFAKVFFVVYVASKLSLGPVLGKTFPRVGYRIVLATLAFGGLLLIQRDMGMAVLVFLMVLAMCYLGGTPLRVLGVMGILGVVAAAGLAFSNAERSERILAWLNPLAYKTGAGYHILTMLVATSRGWIGGLGLGMCPDKWRQMPEPHTDSIFCVMGSELGLIGLIGFLVLMAWIVLRAFQVARWSRDSFGYFLASGFGIMLGLQALINMAVATNLMPVTGLTLPYISYGGSSLVSCLMAAGIVMSVYRHNPPLRKEE